MLDDLACLLSRTLLVCRLICTVYTVFSAVSETVGNKLRARQHFVHTKNQTPL
jgi:hypothetical protein